MHGDHHGAKIIWLEHGFTSFLGFDAFFTPQRKETAAEVFQVLALRRVDDPHAFEGDV